jgi:hypothetical protein
MAKLKISWQMTMPKMIWQSAFLDSGSFVWWYNGVVERVYIKPIIFSGDAVHSYWFRVDIESVEAGSNLQVIFKSKEQT